MQSLVEPIDDSHWHLLRVVVARPDAELAADLLTSMGAFAIEEIDSTPDTVTLRTSLGADLETAQAVFANRFPEAQVAVDLVHRSVADTWRDYVEPVMIDPELWIVPAWCAEMPDGPAVLVEPFDTFGLGNHPTTVLALRLCRKWATIADRLHDHGSGSGVIAVAMAKTHACVVSADDIHPSSRTAIDHNAALNGVEMVEWCEALPPGPLDVIVANILAPVLRDHVSLIESAVRHSGIVVLSGMRHDQVSQVTSLYTQCDVIDSETEDGWTAVALRRH